MSIFAKRLYMSKREKEYKMNKIKQEIDNPGIGGLHQGKVYDLEKMRLSSIYGSFGNQRIEDMYPETIIKPIRKGDNNGQ